MACEEQRLERKKSWRKFMYGYNTVMCLSFGPPMIIMQKLGRKILDWPYEDPVMMGTYGSIVTSVGILSASALMDESKQDRYLPLFETQIMYKIMTCALIANKMRKNEVSSWGIHFLFWFFVVYIVLLLGATPWKPLED
ncbi:MAG: hypothetical protein SWK76_09860 [Actinomycetota bacterium]|nr:hypothetical protein [Actinomycetota bacterium]